MKRASALALLAIGACGPSEPEPEPFTPWNLETLTDEQGFSLRIPEIMIPAGHEDQTCWFITAPDINNGEDYFINIVHTAINPGSHHVNVFRVKSIVGLDPELGEPVDIGGRPGTVVHGTDDYKNSPCWISSNWADWPLVANSQNSEPGTPYTEWKMPEHVAIRFSPGEKLMIQTHYVNTTVQPTPFGGKVGINFHKSPDAAPMEIGTLFATQQSLRICQSNPTPTFSGACHIKGNNVTITAANGHFHSRGKKFSVYAWDGQSIEPPGDSEHFYTSNEWDHPPMSTNIEKPVPQGGGIWWNCEYQWTQPIFGCDSVNEKDPQKQGDCCYVFGGNTDVGEHCNLFLYYYPKSDDGDVFCN
jgi:hypothetical protein